MNCTIVTVIYFLLTAIFLMECFQRVALSTAANMCRKLPSDASDFVMEAVPLLTNLLNYHDSKVQSPFQMLISFMIVFVSDADVLCFCLFQVLEHASVCLTRIAEAFSPFPEKLDELCNHGLVAQAASLVSVSNPAGQASLSTSTYTVHFVFFVTIIYS